MGAVKALGKKRIPSFDGWSQFIVSLGLALGLAVTASSAEAASVASPERVEAKTLQQTATAVAAKDVEETGSIQADARDSSTCIRSRKKMFVESEGWIVRKITTCY